MTLIAKEQGTTPTTATDVPRRPAPGGGDGPEVSASGQILRLLIGVAAVTAIFLIAGLGDLLLFIAILVVIVMLHELAHFATAKWSGMQVTEYFVGFGPRLWSFRRGETEYGVKAFPAGGYVKITGFTVLDEVAPEDEARTYRQQPFWKRIIVASAGSAMHFIIAFVLALIIAFSWGTPSNDLRVTTVPHIAGMTTPAQLAGLRSGDVIVSVNGKAFTSVTALHDDVVGKSGVPITLGVERDGRLLHIRVTPADGRGVKVGGQFEAPAKAKTPRGFIGVSTDPTTSSLGFASAVGHAGTNVGSSTKLEVLGVGKIFSASGLSSFYDQVTNPKVAAKDASNPGTDIRPVSVVGIASLGVQSQQAGLESLLQLLIFVNVIFALLNMLPILPLDGGHVAVAIYEWIRTKKGKPFYRADITKMFPVVAVFLAFLSVIVVSAIYLDITHPLSIPH
jgi:membrane-associated protease RseP (regulator of RpoE activity)